LHLSSAARSSALWSALLLAGCSSPPPPPPPTIVNLTVTADGGVNPDPSGNAAPVTVRIYQLASDGAFMSADFFQLAGKEDATLGKDLVAKDELTMLPNTSQSLVVAAKPDTKFLGATAAFRAIDKASWRAEMPVAPNQTVPATLKLKGLTITLSAGG
jgi:type VI secretion system protein VasD